MVRSRSSSCDKLVANAARERQVGEGSVQLSQFSATEPEFNPPEAMLMCRDALQAFDRGADRLRRAWRHYLAAIVAGR